MVSHYLLARQHQGYKSDFAKVDKQRVLAEANFRQVRRTVDFFVEESDKAMREKPELFERRRKMLEAALTHYQDFIKQQQDDPLFEAEVEDRASAWPASLRNSP